MDMALKQRFHQAWAKYFPGAELPILFYYTDAAGRAQAAPIPPPEHCIVCALAEVLTFAVPWPKFLRMVDNVEESFLITGSWDQVRARIGGGRAR